MNLLLSVPGNEMWFLFIALAFVAGYFIGKMGKK